MQQTSTIWIYSLPDVHYLIAKRRPFSYQLPYMDATGTMTYQIVNGVNIPMPTWEHIVKDTHGQVWASFQDKIYDVTDLY
jgi:hypothetical protein